MDIGALFTNFARKDCSSIARRLLESCAKAAAQIRPLRRFVGTTQSDHETPSFPTSHGAIFQRGPTICGLPI